MPCADTQRSWHCDGNGPDGRRRAFSVLAFTYGEARAKAADLGLPDPDTCRLRYTPAEREAQRRQAMRAAWALNVEHRI